MKLALQIAAGILIASLILWVGGMLFGVAALTAFSKSLPTFPATQHAHTDTSLKPAPYTQQQMDRWNAETDAEEVRERAQAARCTVRTADGRVLHCDSGGPLSPR
jgi:hypothetical protein